jgi:Domain of unknown function (DUF1707)
MKDMRNVRVGDAEREHVLDLLQRAVGRGLIGVDDFTARTDTAMAAITRSELNAVLVDIPGAEAAPDRVTLSANPSTAVVRRGLWTVPREIVVRNRWNKVELDFTAARFPYRELRLELDAIGGQVEVRLPEGATVTVHNLDSTWWSGVADKRTSADTGLPFVVISGRMRLSHLLIS